MATTGYRSELERQSGGRFTVAELSSADRESGLTLEIADPVGYRVYGLTIDEEGAARPWNRQDDGSSYAFDAEELDDVDLVLTAVPIADAHKWPLVFMSGRKRHDGGPGGIEDPEPVGNPG